MLRWIGRRVPDIRVARTTYDAEKTAVNPRWARPLAPKGNTCVLVDLNKQLTGDSNVRQSDAVRADLKKPHIKAVIPLKSNGKITICYDKKLHRVRNWIERVFGHLKINRTIATRYDQLAEPSWECYTWPWPAAGSNLRPREKSFPGENPGA